MNYLFVTKTAAPANPFAALGGAAGSGGFGGGFSFGVGPATPAFASKAEEEDAEDEGGDAEEECQAE